MLVNGGPDDVMRMPGCIFGGTFQFFSKDCVTRARFALEGIWAFAVGQGWIVPTSGPCGRSRSWRRRPGMPGVSKPLGARRAGL